MGGKNAETHSQTAFRVRHHGTCSPKGNVFIRSLPAQAGITELCARRGRKSVRAKETEDSKRNQGLVGTTGLDRVETQETVAACTRPTQVCIKWGPRLKREVDTSVHP